MITYNQSTHADIKLVLLPTTPRQILSSPRMCPVTARRAVYYDTPELPYRIEYRTATGEHRVGVFATQMAWYFFFSNKAHKRWYYKRLQMDPGVVKPSDLSPKAV